MKRVAISIPKNSFLCNVFSLGLEKVVFDEKDGRVLMCTHRTPYPVCERAP